MSGSQVKNFSLNDIQQLSGKVVVVTGGNAGIGYGIVKGLVSKGATVIIASRNEERAVPVGGPFFHPNYLR